jgi:muconolactone delta-isomerase
MRETMKILALEHELPGAAADEFQRLALAEAGEAWKLNQAGLVRELYFRADRREAVLVLECASTEEAEGVLARLPYVREGLISFELIPLVAYPGFARLFTEDEGGPAAE